MSKNQPADDISAKEVSEPEALPKGTKASSGEARAEGSFGISKGEYTPNNPEIQDGSVENDTVNSQQLLSVSSAGTAKVSGNEGVEKENEGEKTEGDVVFLSERVRDMDDIEMINTTSSEVSTILMVKAELDEGKNIVENEKQVADDKEPDLSKETEGDVSLMVEGNNAVENEGTAAEVSGSLIKETEGVECFNTVIAREAANFQKILSAEPLSVFRVEGPMEPEMMQDAIKKCAFAQTKATEGQMKVNNETSNKLSKVAEEISNTQAILRAQEEEADQQGRSLSEMEKRMTLTVKEKLPTVEKQDVVNDLKKLNQTIVKWLTCKRTFTGRSKLRRG